MLHGSSLFESLWTAMDVCLAMAELQAALPSAPKSVSSTSLILSMCVSAAGFIEGSGRSDTWPVVDLGRPRRSGGTGNSGTFVDCTLGVICTVDCRYVTTPSNGLDLKSKFRGARGVGVGSE